MVAIWVLRSLIGSAKLLRFVLWRGPHRDVRRPLGRLSRMSDQVIARDENENTGEVQRLKANAVGIIGVMFMAVATAAPITAMVGNVPIAVGFGNGSHAPAGYIVATVVLSLFAIGYATMAKHLTATGAFYGYIAHGLGRIVGLASGALITMAYVVFEGSLIGIFSFFFKNLMQLAVRHQRALDTPGPADVGAQCDPRLLRHQHRRQGSGRLPADRDHHAVAGCIRGACSTAAVPTVSLSVRRSTRSGRSNPQQASSEPVRDWASSSPSGPGWGSSRPRCTARSRATPSESCPVPPCSAWSASGCSTCSSRGWPSQGPARSNPSTSRRTPRRRATSSSGPSVSTTASGRSRCSTSCCARDLSRAAWPSTTARRATCTRLAGRASRRGCRRPSARRMPSTARRTSRRWCRVESRW